MSGFGIYCRASEEDGDGLSSDPAEQEAEGRAWLDRNELDAAEVVTEVASGALGADDRKLGHLIEQVERGELAGIVVRDEKRFARDVVAGGAALARIVDAGGRLVATWTGFDTANITPESEMVFNMMLAVGQAERKRNRLRRIHGKQRRAERGEYCARTPFGYRRRDELESGAGRDGHLVIYEPEAEVVRAIFAARAAGASFSDLARLHDMSRGGARHIVRSRVYVGEQRIPDPNRTGEPRVVTAHPPIVTEKEWQAANAVKGAAPKHTGVAGRRDAFLAGIARCGHCGSRMYVVEKRGKSVMYACTRKPGLNGEPCGNPSIAATKLEPAVAHQTTLALAIHEPHVVAVMEGDTRYEDALADVEQAQADLAEFRDSIEIQRELGVKGFTEGLRTRKAAVETARKALREIPRPDDDGEPRRTMTLEEYDAYTTRRHYARLIAEVLVYPRDAEHRVMLRWRGAEEPIVVPEFRPEPLPVALAA